MVSDEMLSQDEIDALLRGDTNDDVNEVEAPLVIEDYLSLMEQDALGEIGNISFGSSATALSTLLNQKVDITTPTVSIIEKSKLIEEFPHPYVAIQVEYTEGFSGLNVLVIKQSDAAIIADLMLGGDGLNPSGLLDEIQLSAVQEAMNQMMGSAATSMSTIFSKKVDISPPSIELLDVTNGEGENSLPIVDLMVKISFRLRVGDLIDSNIMQLLPLSFAKGLVQELLGGAMQDDSTEQEPVTVKSAEVQSNQSTTQAAAAIQQPVYEQQCRLCSNQYMNNRCQIVSSQCMSNRCNKFHIKCSSQCRLQMNHSILVIMLLLRNLLMFNQLVLQAFNRIHYRNLKRKT